MTISAQRGASSARPQEANPGAMGVDDGVYVRAAAINGKMHADFAGNVAVSGEQATVVVDDNHIDRAQKGLAAACRRGEDAMLVKANGKIAGGSGREAEAVHPVRKTSELTAKFPAVLREVCFSHDAGFVNYPQVRDCSPLKRSRKGKKRRERLYHGGCGVRCHFMQPHCAKPWSLPVAPMK